MTDTITEESTVTETGATTEEHIISEKATNTADAATTAEAANTADAATTAEATTTVEAEIPVTQKPEQPEASKSTESAYNAAPEPDPFDKAEKERESSGFFAHFSSKLASIHSRREAKLMRDEIILSRIPDTDLMEYLKLEQQRLETQQHAKEIREKRIWIAFLTTVILIAAVLIIYFLKDNPAILISILYTAGLLIAFNIWNRHKGGHTPKEM